MKAHKIINSQEILFHNLDTVENSGVMVKCKYNVPGYHDICITEITSANDE